MVKSTRTECLPIQLRALQIEDFPVVEKWSKDHAFCLANGWETGRSKDEFFSWWHNCVHNHSHNFLRLGIEFESKLIGYADLANINTISAEIGIAIGESKAWGRGFGTAALKQLMIYATEKYGTQVFDAETHKTNIRSKNMLEKLGFTEISRIGSEEYMGKDNQLIQYQYNKEEYTMVQKERVTPKHIISAATVVLNDKNEVLLIKGPRRGWEMPGGQVEEGESLKDAAIRETKEESGIDVEIVKFCGVFQNVSGSICNTLFLARAIGGTPTTSPESLEVGFYPVEQALEMVTYKNFRERIEYCLKEEMNPFYIEFN